MIIRPLSSILFIAQRQDKVLGTVLFITNTFIMTEA